MNPDIPFDLDTSRADDIQVVEPNPFHEGTSNMVPAKKKIDFRRQHPGKFIVTQSDMRLLIRKGEEIPHCPLQFMEVKIFRNFEFPESLSMLKGSYFETLCLGKGAGGKRISDLPRKALTDKRIREMIASGIPESDILGEKTIDQERIEQQAMRFPMRVDELKMVVHEQNTQVPVLKHLWGDVYLSGELDIWPTTMMTPEGLRWVVVDLKLTGDVNSQWGDFCWGTPEHMDHTQGHIYLELIENIDLDLNPHLKPLYASLPKVFEKANKGDFEFYYWVWGYKKEPLHLQEKCNIRVRYGPTERAELKESIRKYVAIVEHYLSMDEIPTNPSYELCKNCPVGAIFGGYCTHMTLTQVV